MSSKSYKKLAETTNCGEAAVLLDAGHRVRVPTLLGPGFREYEVAVFVHKKGGIYRSWKEADHPRGRLEKSLGYLWDATPEMVERAWADTDVHFKRHFAASSRGEVSYEQTVKQASLAFLAHYEKRVHNPTFDDSVRETAHHLPPATANALRHKRMHHDELVAEFGSLPLSHLTLQRYDAWHEKLTKGRPAAYRQETRRRQIIYIRSMMDHAGIAKARQPKLPRARLNPQAALDTPGSRGDVKALRLLLAEKSKEYRRSDPRWFNRMMFRCYVGVLLLYTGRTGLGLLSARWGESYMREVGGRIQLIVRDKKGTEQMRFCDRRVKRIFEVIARFHPDPRDGNYVFVLPDYKSGDPHLQRVDRPFAMLRDELQERTGRSWRHRTIIGKATVGKVSLRSVRHTILTKLLNGPGVKREHVAKLAGTSVAMLNAVYDSTEIEEALAGIAGVRIG